MNIIVEFEFNGDTMTIYEDNGVYNVEHYGKIVQPNHDANGVIRYLANALHNSNFALTKMDIELSNALVKLDRKEKDLHE